MFYIIDIITCIQSRPDDLEYISSDSGGGWQYDQLLYFRDVRTWVQNKFQLYLYIWLQAVGQRPPLWGVWSSAPCEPSAGAPSFLPLGRIVWYLIRFPPDSSF